MERIAVVGAGPVGSLAALALADRGCTVDLYERQPEPSASSSRTAGNTRSINLAISTRALTALASMGGDALADSVLAMGIPMRARMIHHVPKPARLARKEHDDHVRVRMPPPAAPSTSSSSEQRPLPSSLPVEPAPYTAPSFDSVAPSPVEEKPNTLFNTPLAAAARRRSSLASVLEVVHKQTAVGQEDEDEDEDLVVALDSQDYGIDPATHRIYSVDRSKLSALLLARAAAHPRINVHWGHALQGVHFPELGASNTDEQVELEFEHTRRVDGASNELHRVPGVKRQAHMVIGCDGMHSVVRRSLDAIQPLDIEQRYINSAYLELHIPAPAPVPVPDGKEADGTERTAPGPWPLSPEHLHIWPRHSFMLIALPNADRSFTCTLFAPYALFGAEPPLPATSTPRDDKKRAGAEKGQEEEKEEATAHPLAGALSTPTRALAFFRTYFPDALALMGTDHVEHAISARAARPGRLGSVLLRSGVYHEAGPGRAVLLGDAAHAMVPFYGQGLNCGLEDVRVLVEVLERAGVLPLSSVPKDDASLEPGQRSRATTHLVQALSTYSRTRHPALCAILGLAQQNYEEMSHRVVSRAYLARKWLDGVLMRLFAPRPRSRLALGSRLMSLLGVGPAGLGTGTEVVLADGGEAKGLRDEVVTTEGAGPGSASRAAMTTRSKTTTMAALARDVSLALLRSCFHFQSGSKPASAGSKVKYSSQGGYVVSELSPTLPSALAATPSPSKSAPAPASAHTPRRPAAEERALGTWKSLYTMVTFTNMPYDAVLRQAKLQDGVVSGVLVLLGVGVGVGVGRVVRRVLGAGVGVMA